MMRMVGLTKWLLGQGLFMNDGDTIGDDAERIHLSFDDQGGRTHGPIIRMRIETLTRMGG